MSCSRIDYFLPYKVTDLEFVMQGLNVILHSLYELCLIFSDGSTYVGAHKEGIVARENTKHLIGILGSTKLVPEPRSYAGLHTVNTLVIPGELQLEHIL